MASVPSEINSADHFGAGIKLMKLAARFRHMAERETDPRVRPQLERMADTYEQSARAAKTQKTGLAIADQAKPSAHQDRQ